MLSFSSKYVMYPKKLGEGGGGVVYEGKEKETGKKVAVKLIRKSRTDESANKRLLMEVEVLRVVTELKHKHIMALHDFYEEAFRFILVLEYVPGGDLFDRIVAKERYSEHDARVLVTELIQAVSALHRINVLHRDIKPENVLMAAVDSDSEILLGDFGLAIISESSLVENHVGTLQYRAPEMFNHEHHFKPADVWSIGAVLFVLLSGTFPFDDSDEERIETKIVTGDLRFPQDVFGNVSAESIDLIKCMLTVDQTKRYTLDDVILHPWMHKEKNELFNKELIEAFDRLKMFDASRKLKAAMTAVRGAIRMHIFKRRKRALSDGMERDGSRGDNKEEDLDDGYVNKSSKRDIDNVGDGDGVVGGDKEWSSV